MGRGRYFEEGDDIEDHLEVLRKRFRKIGGLTDGEKLAYLRRSLAEGTVRARYDYWLEQKNDELAANDDQVDYTMASEHLKSIYQKEKETNMQDLYEVVRAAKKEEWDFTDYRKKFVKNATKGSEGVRFPAPEWMVRGFIGNPETFDEKKNEYLIGFMGIVEKTYSTIFEKLDQIKAVGTGRSSKIEDSDSEDELLMKEAEDSDEEVRVLDLLRAMERKQGRKKAKREESKKPEKGKGKADDDDRLSELAKQFEAISLRT
ncbi:hypothetical protein HDU97_009952, partial [Phlyctochytrium planicorne]